MELPSQVSARASILKVPPASVERALQPVLGALCACTRGGEHLEVSARILPASGQVRAGVAAAKEVDACLSRRLDPGHFEPFAATVAECADCGPHRVVSPARPGRIAAFQAANGTPPGPNVPGPTPPFEAPIVIPFAYDRPAP